MFLKYEELPKNIQKEVMKDLRENYSTDDEAIADYLTGKEFEVSEDDEGNLEWV